MCDPVLFGTTLASGATTTGLFGVGGSFAWGATLSTAMTGLSLVSSYQQSKAQADVYSQQAAIYRQQEDLAYQQAQDAIQRGQVEEDAHRRKVAAFKGNQTAKLGSNLVDLDSGSASDLQADTAMLGELDALTIRNNAQREAYAHKSQGRVYGMQGSTSDMQASQAKSSAKWDLAGGLLGMGGKAVSGKWYDSKSSGGGGSSFNYDPIRNPLHV